MQRIIDEFNLFFEGTAKAKLEGDTLKITIGSQTLTIQISSLIGLSSKGQ